MRKILTLIIVLFGLTWADMIKDHAYVISAIGIKNINGEIAYISGSTNTPNADGSYNLVPQVIIYDGNTSYVGAATPFTGCIGSDYYFDSEKKGSCFMGGTMKGATASANGESGLVPAPAAGQQSLFLRGDGTWAAPEGKNYSNATTSTSGLMSAADKTKLDNLDLSGLNNKLDKTTYEYNKEANLGSSNTVIKIGTFPCYDSNITIDISSTTTASYNGTLIIATQNVRAGAEGYWTARVYGDSSNILTPLISLERITSTNTISAYISLPSWSKTLFHIQGVALDGNPTDVVTAISSVPSTATVKPINASRLDMANMIYPVGAIYISVSNTSPASLFGGTWEQIQNVFLLSAGSSYSAGSTGGSASNSHTHNVTTGGTVQSHTLTEQQLPYITGHAAGVSTWGSQTGGHMSGEKEGNGGGGSGGNWTTLRFTFGGGQGHSHGFSGTTVTSGGASDTNNMPPYLAVYMWKRTA